MIRVMRWLPWATRAAPPRAAAGGGASASPRLALEAVHAEHVDFVWATLQRLGVRDSELEDLTQEVFIVVHGRLHTFDPAQSMPAWLFGICRRVSAAHRRRAYVRRERAAEEVAAGAEHEGAGPEEAVHAREARERLDGLLDQLDADKRAVLVMFEIDEMPCEAIAEQLGVPVGTVYSRLHAARKAFERALARSRARDARGGAP